MDPGDDRPAGFAVTSWVQFECRFLWSNGSSTAWHTDYIGAYLTFYYFLYPPLFRKNVGGGPPDATF